MPPIDPFTLEQMAGGSSDVHAGRPRSCPECGYDLRGTPLSRPCPECGWYPQGSRIGESSAQPEGTPCIKCGQPVVGMVFGAICPDCAVGRGKRAKKLHLCKVCGYSLKGLGPSPACPECGEGARSAEGGTSGGRKVSVGVLRRWVPLPTMTPDVQASIGMQLGLVLLVVISGLWAMLAVSRTVGLIGNADWAFIVKGSAVGLVVACVLATPARADGKARAWLLPTRWLARLLIVGLILGAMPWGSQWTEAAFAFTGLVGLTILLWILAMYARVNEAQHVSRQFELGWIFALPCGVVSWLLPFPGKVAALPQTAGGFVVMLMMLFMLIPTFVLCWYIFRPSLTLLRESIWASRNVRQQGLIDRSRRGEGKCRSCGYPLKKLDRPSPCPECGSDP